MKLPPHLLPGQFIERTSRFSARVSAGHGIIPVHVPNSGRLLELLVSGARVWLAPPGWLHAAAGIGRRAVAGSVRAEAWPPAGAWQDTPPESGGRRTAADLLLVESRGEVVCVDARLPPLLVAEALGASGWEGLPGGRLVREPTWGRGRFDLAVGGWMIECKSVTLVRHGVALFPDAPTVRGRRHLEGLARLAPAAAVVFVVQRADACCFAPNRDTDPAFAAALVDAAGRGVLVLAGKCRVSRKEIVLAEPLPVCLSAVPPAG